MTTATTATLLVRPSVERAVERVGTCADGCCPRFHCRACDGFWLGNEAEHACGSAVPELEQRIYAWMAEELAAVGDLATCERNVLERVKAEGLGEALLDMYGARLIDELWRYRDRHDDDIPRTRERQPTPVTPGVRRVDVKQLATGRALLECIFVVAGRWVRLGDLNKRQCETLQRQYATAAGAFGKLAASLADNQIVRDLWTAQQVEDLAGDTLRRAASVRP